MTYSHLQEDMGKRRATNSTEKRARRERILRAAEALLQRWSLDDVNVDRIADLAGVAKGTVYLYYRTREELMLEVFVRHHGLWCDVLERRINAAADDPTPDDIGEMVVASLAADPLLLELFGRVGGLLRGSVSPRASRRFREHRTTRITQVAAALERRIKNVTALRAAQWLVRIESVIAGMVSLAHGPPARVATVDPHDAGLPDPGLDSELRFITISSLSSP